MAVSGETGHLADTVAGKAEELANRSKQVGAEAITGVAQTAQSVADAVADQSPAVAEYVRGAGEKIEQLASDLRHKKVEELLQSAAEFGRSRPVVLLAGAALVGFALSRVVKAGATAAKSSKVSTGDEP